jgi:DNA polymerase-4
VPTRRLIAHLDMDAFYASVELLRYPQLRGLPVVIGGRSAAPEVEADGTLRFRRLRDYVGRGVITTATYPARALGLHSGLGLMKAAVLAPDAILLPADFDAYRRASKQFKAAVQTIVPSFEDRGIDEIYLDLSDRPDTDADAGRDVALRLKQAVREATGLSCSIAVAPNKLLAKIGSDLDKPDGLTLLGPPDLAARIWPLPARRINGIGPKAAARLESLGIRTIGELAAADPQLLVEHFGSSTGRWMHEAAHGRDDRPVVTHSEPKSISRETTFGRDLHAVRDRDELGAILTELCEHLARDLARKRVAARTVGIKLRYHDFRIVTRDLRLETPAVAGAEIRRAAGRCLKRVDLGPRLRLLGVRASSLQSTDGPADDAPGMADDRRLREPELPLFDDSGNRMDGDPVTDLHGVPGERL